MPDEESISIMPYSDISELKKQAKKVSEQKGESEQLLSSVNTLTRSMDSMLQLFRNAVDEMKIEEEEEKAISHQIQPLMDKLDEIIEQNKIIAEGMVAISDIIRERIPEKMAQIPRQMPPPQMAPPMPPPVFPNFQSQQSPFDNPSMNQQMPPPMPPPQMAAPIAKKGIFGK